MSRRNAILVFHQDPAEETRRKRLLSGGSWTEAVRLLNTNLHHTVNIARQVRDADVILVHDGAGPHDVDVVDRIPQRGHRLGDRMRNAAEHARARGYERLVIVGTDAPALSRADMERALEALSTAEYAIGPSKDGGFFLLAFHSDQVDQLPLLLASLPWFTRNVLSQLLRRCESMRARAALLPALGDIDSWSDLRRLRGPLWASLPWSHVRWLIARGSEAVSLPARQSAVSALVRFFRLVHCPLFLPAPPPAF